MNNIKRISSIFYGFLLLAVSLAILINNQGATQPLLADLIVSDQESSDELDSDSFQEDFESQDIKTKIIEAIELAQSDEWHKAVENYRDILVGNPNHQLSAINLANLLVRKKGCQQAQKEIDYGVSISRGKRLAKILSLQGYCYTKLGFSDKAIASIKRSIEFRPDHSLTWKRLAKAEIKQGVKPEGVIISLKRALALNPNNINLRIYLARFQLERLDFRGSINTLKQNYSHIKSNHLAQMILAWSYFELGKKNNAKKHVQIASQLNKSNLLMARAMESFNNKNYKEVIEIIKNSNESNLDYKYILALSYEKRGWHKSVKKYSNSLIKSKRYGLRFEFQQLQIKKKKLNHDQVFEAYQDLLKRGVSENYLAYSAAKYFQGIGKYEKAHIWLENLNYPNPVRGADYLFASVLWQLGQQVEAIRILEKYIEIEPNNIKASRLLSRYLFDTNNIESSLKLLSALPYGSYKPKDLLLKSRAFTKLNKAKEAEDTLREAIEYWPDNTDIRLAFVKSLIANKKMEEGRHQLEMVLRLDHSNLEAKKYLTENFQ